MLAALAISAQRAISLRIQASSSCGVLPEREDAEIADFVGELRRIHHRANIGRQLVEHRRGHARRGDKGVERNDVEARIGLGDRRHVRRIAETLRAGAGDQLEIAGRDVAPAECQMSNISGTRPAITSVKAGALPL